MGALVQDCPCVSSICITDRQQHEVALMCSRYVFLCNLEDVAGAWFVRVIITCLFPGFAPPQGRVKHPFIAEAEM